MVMAFFSDAQETVSEFGACIDELQDLFRRDAVDFGAPDDFIVFARRLKQDTRLREDLAILTKSMTKRDARVTLRTILTIIAVSSGGPEIAQSGQEMSTPVNSVVDFLIAVGGCSQVDAESLDSSEAADDSKNRTYTIHPSALIPIDSEMPTEQTGISQQAQANSAPELRAFDVSIDPPPAEYFASPSTLTESLTRLELNSLEVRLYLDSIDQRIGRMEPRLENLPSSVLSTAAQSPKDETEARFSATAFPEAEARKPNTDAGEPSKNEAAKRRSQIFVPIQTKLHRMFTSSSRYTLPVLLAVMAVVLVGFLYWSSGQNATHAVRQPENSPLDANIGPSPATSSPSRPAVSARSSTANASLSPPTGAVPAAEGGAITDKVPSNASASARPSPSLSTSAPAEIATSTSNVASSPAPPANRTYKGHVTNSFPRRVNVSSGVMAASLLSAPEPSYPRLASLTHLQGNVVMQAVISKKGTVENLRVIKGHFLLRNAAEKAVRTWRFRPYLIGGEPVEVATIVSVDFTLPH